MNSTMLFGCPAAVGAPGAGDGETPALAADEDAAVITAWCLALVSSIMRLICHSIRAASFATASLTA